jgi:hypothetical protein
MASKKKTAKKTEAPITEAIRSTLSALAGKAAECIRTIDRGSQSLTVVVGEAHAAYVAKGKRSSKGFYGVWSAMLPVDIAGQMTKGRVSQLVKAAAVVSAFGSMTERKARELAKAIRDAGMDTDTIGLDARKAVADAGGVDAFIAAQQQEEEEDGDGAGRASADDGKPRLLAEQAKADPLAFIHDSVTRAMLVIGSDRDLLLAGAEALEILAKTFRKAAEPKAATPAPSADGKARKVAAKV